MSIYQFAKDLFGFAKKHGPRQKEDLVVDDTQQWPANNEESRSYSRKGTSLPGGKRRKCPNALSKGGSTSP